MKRKTEGFEASARRRDFSLIRELTGLLVKGYYKRKAFAEQMKRKTKGFEAFARRRKSAKGGAIHPLDYHTLKNK